MDAMDWGQLGYLALLAAALVFWFIVHNRQSLGKLMQQMAAWVLIFIAVIAVIGLWDDIRQTVLPTQAVFADEDRIEVPRRPNGHYYLTLMINETPVDFVVDTGATDVVLSHEDARRIGLDVDNLAYIGRAKTANGEVRTAPVRLETVELGPVVDHDLPAWVNEGDMFNSLLGMTYLQRWGKIEIGGGSLVLTR